MRKTGKKICNMYKTALITNYMFIKENILVKTNGQNVFKNNSQGKRWWRSRWTWSTSLSTDTSGIHLLTGMLAEHQLRAGRST